VGFRDIHVESGGETLRVALWYPADATSGQSTVGPFTMAASRDAPIGGGRHGLVLISHGTGGGRFNHRDTAIRLAGAGYIVAAPEHAGDSWRDGR
jgi:predicted dienelactone hydrolase